MKKEIYIHLGLPKTATTTLQNRVFLDQQHDFLYLGKHNSKYISVPENKDDWISKLKSDLVLKDAPFFDSNDITSVLGKNIDRHMSSKKYLLSEEAFLSRCLNPDHYGDLITFGSPRHVLNNLYHMFLGRTTTFNVRLILVLRFQPDLIESFFAQSFFRYKKYLGINTPDEFAQYIFNLGDYSPIDSLLRYDSLISFIDGLFGEENLLVLPYEKMKSDPDIFLQKISSYMGIPPWNAQALKKNRDNFADTDKGKLATVPPLSHRLVKIKNYLFGDVSFGVQKYFRGLDRFTPNKSVAMSDDMKEKLFLRYRQGNENLKSRVPFIEEFSYY